jgi:hypothetical protein
MKISSKFKEITKPIDIDNEDINLYLKNLYEDTSYKENDITYVENTLTETERGYKNRANKLVDELINLSGNSKFEELRNHFKNTTLPGESRNIVDEMKKTAEMICFKLKHGVIATPNKFIAEIKSATLNACTSGALTNMQKILYSMNDSMYYYKYDFIQNLALEYIRQNKLSNPGNEAHKANELIHELSPEYNVIPPKDLYTKYRDLSSPPTEAFIENILFKSWFNDFTEKRIGVYSFAEYVVNTSASNLPEGKSFPIKNKKTNEDSEELVQINSIADKFNITVDALIDFSEDGEHFIYKGNYLSFLKCAVIKHLIDEGLIKQEPLIVKEQRIINIPERAMMIKGEKKIVSKAQTINQELANKIIETPDGWYLTEDQAGKTSPVKKLLDNSLLQKINDKYSKYGRLYS